MKKMTTAEIKTATTKDLVEFYNANCAKVGNKPVKKFVNRTTAEARVAVLIDEIANGPATPAAPKGKKGKAAPKGKKGKAAPKGKKDEPKEPKSRSEGIAKSWTKNDVAAKRAQRSAVEVDGEYFGSVRKAYLGLGLPLNDHIQFRMHLKEKGKVKVEGRTWKIVPLNYDK